MITIPFGITIGALLLTGFIAQPAPPKLAIALRVPLNQLNETVLFPYRVTDRQVLESAVVEALGTDQYIDWWLENSAVATTDPMRYAHLFVTYDTGGANLVPHTPDECRLGAGYQFAREPENREVSLPQLPGNQAKARVRLCTFLKTAVFNSQQDSVIYTFCANGRIYPTRNEVRAALADPTKRYAYFSKVEISFPKATPEQTLAGATELLDRLMPALVRDHFPDIDGVEAAAKNEGHR